MDKVKLAIVGCGTISQLNAPGYLGHPGCEIVALCDPLRERAERRANEWGIRPRVYERFEDLLEDPEVDAVELLTPTSLHAEQAVAALDAGKHVSCQKPLSNTVAEADRIVAAVERAGTVFRVTENFLYYPPIVKARELLDSGTIGEPSLLRIRTLWGSSREDIAIALEPGAKAWRRESVNAGGLAFDDGWHKYATAQWWLGDVEKVSAVMSGPDDVMVEAPSVVTWKFKGRNCLGVFEFASAEQMPIRSRYYPADEFFEIQGPKGAIWVTRCTGEMLDMPPVMLVKGNETVEYQVPMDWIEGFNGAARDFIDSIQSGRQPQMDVAFSKRVLQSALAAYRASDTERPVDPAVLA